MTRLKINLTKSVPLKELCKISAIGNTADTAYRAEFTLSREAIIGFATELLWLYEDISDNRMLNIATHQLRIDPTPNQALGFYLTPDSPILMLKVNSLTKGTMDKCECKKWKEINIKKKNINRYYDVKDPSNKDNELICLETYELSRKNIINITLFNEEGKDITKSYGTVIFEINRKGIKEFATMLLVWADNCKEGDEYLLSHLDKLEEGYNLGILLMHDSIFTKLKCHDLGIANDYDLRF